MTHVDGFVASTKAGVGPDEYRDFAARMADPRIAPGVPMPFDGKRLIFGGFQTLLDA